MGESASAFANGESQKEALAVWRKMKTTHQKSLPTDQEWCHLVGHGDGGHEIKSNFVAGSFHCNTEQLAIESGQRWTTYKNRGKYKLNVRGFLLSEAVADTPHQPQPLMGQREHPAVFIRYRIFRKETNDQWVKIFDYLFEAQSEFFDENQYNLLEHYVRLLLKEVENPGSFDTWYQQQLSGNYEDLLKVANQLKADQVWNDQDRLKEELAPFEWIIPLDSLPSDKNELDNLIRQVLMKLNNAPVPHSDTSDDSKSDALKRTQ